MAAKTHQSRDGGRPRRARKASQPTSGDLRSAGELVSQGGLAGAMMTLLYIAIGLAFWSLIGYGVDRLLGTRWIVWLGAGIGAFAGFYLVYLHMRQRDD
jgi:ATP synthase protein I